MGYDALGRCVKRSFPDGTITFYVYDGEKPIVEHKPAGTQTANNTYGKAVDEILMRFDTAIVGHELYFYQHDHEGSVTHLTDWYRNVVETYRYDAFGKATIYNGSGTDRAADWGQVK